MSFYIGAKMKPIEISGLIENGMWNYGDELNEKIFAGPQIKEMANVKSGAYLWTKANKSDKTVYGALYNWSAIGDKLCPAGWHVATYKDWETLVNYCGGWEIAGGKLKETGTAHWDAPNIGATNNFGFTALPTWEHGSSDGYWCPPRFGYLISMGSDRTWIYLTECHDCVANSVRCVKD